MQRPGISTSISKKSIERDTGDDEASLQTIKSIMFIIMIFLSLNKMIMFFVRGNKVIMLL